MAHVQRVPPPAPLRAGLALRWVRAALLGGVALGSGVLAHVAAQGRMPGPSAVLVLYAVVTAACAALLGRAASTPRVVVLVVAGQTVVHGTLTALAGHRGDPPLTQAPAAPATPVPVPSAATSTGSGRSGSYYDLAYAGAHPRGGQQLSVPAPVQHLLADLTGPHAVMAVAHLAAAAVVGLWLAVGERALWAALAVLLSSAVAGVAGVLGAAARRPRLVVLGTTERPAPTWSHVVPPRLPALASVARRRGPPLLAS